MEGRLFEHIKRRGNKGEGLNLANPDDIKFAWQIINEVYVPHAEFRALDDLLKQISPNRLPETIFDDLIGYNSFLKKDGIMVRCADCFYLTDGVKFLE